MCMPAQVQLGRQIEFKDEKRSLKLNKDYRVAIFRNSPIVQLAHNALREILYRSVTLQSRLASTHRSMYAISVLDKVKRAYIVLNLNLQLFSGLPHVPQIIIKYCRSKFYGKCIKLMSLAFSPSLTQCCHHSRHI
jgi:hypothetical protein